MIKDISRGRYVDFEEIPTYELSLGDDKNYFARGRPVLGERRECLGAMVTFQGGHGHEINRSA